MNLLRIPKKILDEWRAIGVASNKAYLHQKNYQKKLSSMGWLGWSMSNNLNNNFPPKNNLIKGPINSAIEKVKSEYLKSLEPMATRKCSEKYLEIVSKISNLIGGSADLAGSNNTKTKNHNIIKARKFFRKLYSLRCKRTCNVRYNEWFSFTQWINSLRGDFFNF